MTFWEIIGLDIPSFLRPQEVQQYEEEVEEYVTEVEETAANTMEQSQLPA
jgi:hypothetical protein